MPVALKCKAVERLSRRGRKIICEPTFSGNYIQIASNPNEVLDLTAITGYEPGQIPGELPSEMYFENEMPGYKFQVIPGTTLKNSAVRITTEADAAELGAAGYPAGITDDDDKMRLVIVTRF